MPRLRVAMGKFIIKNAVLRVPRWKNAPNVSPYAILFICCSSNVYQSGLISRSLLCPENWLHAWSTTWLADKVNVSQLAQRRCDNVVALSKMRVVPTSVSDVVTMSLSDVIKTLPQRCYNVTATLTIGFLDHFATEHSDFFPFIKTWGSYESAKWH